MGKTIAIMVALFFAGAAGAYLGHLANPDPVPCTKIASAMPIAGDCR